MKNKQLVEIISQHHPDMTHAEIQLKINLAQDDFCAKTEVIEKTYRQNTIAGQRYYTLDSNILKVVKVQLDDIDIDRLITPPVIDDDEFDASSGRSDGNKGSTKFAWYISNGRIGVVEYIPEGITVGEVKTKWQSISTKDKELRVFTISKAYSFPRDGVAWLTDTSEIPTQFHEALAYKVIGDGYLLGSNLKPDLSQLFAGRYMAEVKEAKKYAKGKFVTNGVIKPQDF